MRGLSQHFLQSMTDPSGLLQPLVDCIRKDWTLDLQIRNNYVNIYYRGGNLLRVRLRKGQYIAEFEKNYAKKYIGTLLKLPVTNNQARDLKHWIAAIPTHKAVMDQYFSAGGGVEREFQQLIVRDNNMGKMGKASDIFICDIEYALKGSRFDMVGVQWPSTGADRKRQKGHRLVLIEVKYGDSALRGGANLAKHIKDIDRFLGVPANLVDIKKEMVDVFNQKRRMKLINCSKDLVSFSDEPPIVMLILANHDPDSSILRNDLAKLPTPKKAELRFATSTFMGYGLFTPSLLTLSQLQTRFRASI